MLSSSPSKHSESRSTNATSKRVERGIKPVSKARRLGADEVEGRPSRGGRYAESEMEDGSGQVGAPVESAGDTAGPEGEAASESVGEPGKGAAGRGRASEGEGELLLRDVLLLDSIRVLLLQ